MVTEIVHFDDFLNKISFIGFEGTFALPEGSNKLPENSFTINVGDEGTIIVEAVLDNEEFRTDIDGNVVENPDYDGRVTHGQAFIVEGHEGGYTLPDGWDLPQYPPERSEVYINVPFRYEGADYRFIAGLYED